MPPTQLAPSAPMPKQRGLSFVEREEIALERARGTGVRAIARKLGRSPSTISREIRRNSATRSGEFDYRATAAQWHADRAARRPKISKLAVNPALRDYVQDRLSGLIATPDGIAFGGPVVVWKGRRAVNRQSRRWSSAWSPEQIAQRPKVDFPKDPTMRISHEAIYQALYIQGRVNRKNALFAGHDEGGVAWGRIASLIETCKINGIEPFAYLKATLAAIANGHQESRLDDLLPWNFTPSR